MSAPALDIKAVMPIIQKINASRGEGKTNLVERGTPIDLMWLTFIAQSHGVAVGPPGTGKSLLIREAISHIEGAQKFEILLNKTTPPEALVGPISLKALENDEFRRITTGKLPEANVAFLDEIYKSNATNLNLLLPIANERLFHNNGTPTQLDLWSLWGASNEFPTHDRQDLIAFTDRLAIRYMVEPVLTIDGLGQILQGQLARLRGDQVAQSHTTITLDEMSQIQQAARLVSVPNRIERTWAELQIKAHDEGLNPSVRRMFEGLRIGMANALLNERSEVTIEDLRIFEHILWDDPDDIKIARQLTEDFAGEVGKVASKLRGEYEDLAALLTTAQGKFPTDPTERVPEEATNAMTNVSTNLRVLNDRLASAIEDAARDGYDPAELESIQADVKRARRSVKEVLNPELA